MLSGCPSRRRPANPRSTERAPVARLDEVGAAAQLQAHGLAADSTGVGLGCHRPEHPARPRRGGDDPSAGDDPRAVGQPELDGATMTIASSSFDPTSRIVVIPLARSARQDRAQKW